MSDTAEWKFCPACGAALTPGARFCHRCGAEAGVQRIMVPTPAGTRGPTLPWAVAGIALLALLALLAGRGFNRQRPGGLDAPLNALPQQGLDFDRPGDTSVVRGPDISAMSPQERADRLFNRVITLAEQGKRDSVIFFAPMAVGAYRQLAPLNLDQHYDVGRIAEVSGAIPLAKAQSDSILSRTPSHLLGLILAARVAELTGDSTALRRYDARLLAAERAETAKNLAEYQRHDREIVAALAAARSRSARR